MDIVLLGTAAAAGSVQRDNTYMLLRGETGSWMIDVGGNPLGKLKQLGMELSEIRGVMFTHFHVDHIYGLPSLLWGMWIAKRKDPLEIYCLDTDEQQLRSILASFQVEQWPIGFEVRIHTFTRETPSQLVAERDLTVSTFPALHARPTVGFKVQCEDRVLLYSADTRPNEWIREQPRIDVLIHEANMARGASKAHTSLEELLQFYPVDRIGRIVAIHLSDGSPYEEVLAEQDSAIRSKVTLAEDLQVITF